MNPDCDFDWYLLSGKGDCKLAYSKDYFRTKPNYEAYYKDIKKLFTTGNRYIAGFAVSNDVGFVNNANERYELPYIQFRAFDLERYLERKYEKKQKLTEWAQEFGVNVEKFMSHKSVDDAMMTMLCLKAETARTGQTIEQIFTSPEGKNCFVSNEQILEQAAERAYRREITEKIKRLYGKQSPMPRHKTVLGQKFELDHKILRDVDNAFELVKKIYDNGGITGEHLTGKGNAVFISMPHPEHVKKLEKRGLKVMLLEELEALLK
jgi:DNA polymerase III epsilon subunit-like protein